MRIAGKDKQSSSKKLKPAKKPLIDVAKTRYLKVSDADDESADDQINTLKKNISPGMATKSQPKGLVDDESDEDISSEENMNAATNVSKCGVTFPARSKHVMAKSKSPVIKKEIPSRETSPEPVVLEEDSVIAPVRKSVFKTSETPKLTLVGKGLDDKTAADVKRVVSGKPAAKTALSAPAVSVIARGKASGKTSVKAALPGSIMSDEDAAIPNGKVFPCAYKGCDYKVSVCGIVYCLGLFVRS
jgi:hypothetical protein